MAAATFSYPVDFSSQAQIVAADIKANLDAVRTFLIGPNMTAENLAAAAALAGTQIGTGEIPAAAIAAGAVGTTELAGYSVTEAKLADNAVTEAKILYTSARVLRTGTNGIGHCSGVKTGSIASTVDTITVTYASDADHPMSSGFTVAPNISYGLEATTACSQPVTVYITSRSTTAAVFRCETPAAVASTWSFNLHWIAEGDL